jgi:hypothetical protein
MRSLGAWRWCLSMVASLILIATAGAVPPFLSEASQPRDQIVGLGLSASFQAYAGTLLQYRWTKNGEPLTQATQYNLQLPSVTYLDSGGYAAVLSNAAGSVTSRVARLTVVPAARVERLGGLPSVGFVDSFAVDGSLAYLGISDGSAARRGGLEIYDVGDASNPRRVGGLRLAPGQSYTGVSDVVVDGGRAYLAAGGLGSYQVHVLDIADPSHPMPLGKFITDGSALDLVVRGSLAYVATARGLEVLDISDPTSIFRVGSYRTTDPVYTVDLSGSTAYLGATGSGLVILDIADPTTPTWMGSLRGALGLVDIVKVDGDRIYLSGSTGPWVIDVAHPAFPRALGNLGRHRNSHGLGRMGSLLIDGGQLNDQAPQGLFLVDAADPTRMAWVGHAPTAGAVEAVETVGNRIYLAVSAGGFEIFALQSAAHEPVILDPPQGVKAVAGTTAELRVEASGGGPLQFQWLRNGVPLEGQTNRTLRFSAVSQADAAEYGVTVGNAAGQVSGGTTRLSLIEPPSLHLERLQLGDTRGPRLWVGTESGTQGELMGTEDFQAWQPIWYGRFDHEPVAVFDGPGLNAPMRSYRLKLGAR